MTKLVLLKAVKNHRAESPQPNLLTHQPVVPHYKNHLSKASLMLKCRICISRCIRTISADVLHLPQESRLKPASTSRLRNVSQAISSRRGHHPAPFRSYTAYAKNFHQNVPFAARRQTTQATSRIEPWSAPPRLPPKHDEDSLPPKHDEDSKRDVVPHGGQYLTPRETRRLDYKIKMELKKELRYLQDPLKLAEHTMGLLRNSDDGNALKIIRMASKRSQCTVSWNHVIDYEMSKGRVQKAERVYNEVL